MKKILYHFRISLLLGVITFSSFGYQISYHQTQLAQLAAESSTGAISPSPDDTSSPTLPDSPSSPDSDFAFTTDVIIKALNPGYTVDGTRDVGEFIELQKLSDISQFSLAGYGIRYTNSSGNTTLLLDFAEGSLMTGENLLMRLARSPDSDRADATYMTTMAQSAGEIELVYQDNVIDRVCWGKKSDDCLPAFKSSTPTTLLRDLSTGKFAHDAAYEPTFNPAHPSLVLPPPVTPPDSPPSSNDDTANETTARCYELEFSEIFAYYASDKAEQFIELYNPSERTVVLDRCALRYKKKTYYLSGTVAADSYYAYYPAQSGQKFTLTKNPNSSNTLELIDTNGSTVDTLVYNHGQKKSTSYARFYADNRDEIWDQTYSPTPGQANQYQEFRTCPAGKTINPDTGNCINITASSSKTTVCPEGKYLNPLTGRCKKIATDSSGPKPCAAGYERNPETNRCRKIKSTNNGATHALVPNTYSSKSTFIAAGVVVALVTIGVIYIVLQFRREIARTLRKTVQRLHHVFKHLVPRRIRFRRHK